MKRIRLVLCVALIAIVLAAGALFCLSCSAEPSKQAQIGQTTVPTSVAEVAGGTVTYGPGQDVSDEEIAAAEQAVRARATELNTLLDSMIAGGQDKTSQLYAFLYGTPTQKQTVMDEYRERWLAEGGDDVAAVMAGTWCIERVAVNAYGITAGVVLSLTTRDAGGVTSNCVENTVWQFADGFWQRSCSTFAYWHAKGGTMPFEEGTQLDGVAWDLVRIEQVPTAKPVRTGDQIIAVTVFIDNMDVGRRTPGDYSLVLSTPQGASYDVSEATERLFPETAGRLNTAMLRDEKCRLSLAFEVPEDVDLTNLHYTIVKADSPALAGSPGQTDSDGSWQVRAGTPKAWGLAASAVLMSGDAFRDDLLPGQFADAQAVEQCKSGLVEWWGVESREDLLEVLAWLQTEGHRKVWDELSAYVASLSDAELRDFRDRSDEGHQIDAVVKYGSVVGTKSIFAFDLCRYVTLCRKGNLCGYLTDAEAWERIMPAAAKLQATFSSWKEVGENYLIGREFWSYQETLNSGDEMRLRIDHLVATPGSAWNSNPWDLDLGVGALGTM
jgi:hypothetical protein